MKRLLFVTAIIEAIAGLALLTVPSFVGLLLFDADFSGAGIALGRLCGAALLTLGVACWLARADAQGRAARSLVAAMVVYNFGAVVILGDAGIQLQPTGVALWPAIVLHVAMTIWCITSILNQRRRGPVRERH